MEEIDLETARSTGLLAKLTPKSAFGKPKRDPNKPWDDLVADILLLCRHLKVDPPIRELPFHPVRKWRFDLAVPSLKVAIEREGGTFSHSIDPKTGKPRMSRHTSMKGYAEDCMKYSEAAILGWCVIRLTSDRLAKKRRAQVLDQIERAIVSRRNL